MGAFGTFALGVAAALVAQASGRPLARRARPLVRKVMKESIILGEGVRSRSAGLREDLVDLAAEARVEARQQHQQAQVPSNGVRS